MEGLVAVNNQRDPDAQPRFYGRLDDPDDISDADRAAARRWLSSAEAERLLAETLDRLYFEHIDGREAAPRIAAALRQLLVVPEENRG